MGEQEYRWQPAFGWISLSARQRFYAATYWWVEDARGGVGVDHEARAAMKMMMFGRWVGWEETSQTGSTG